MPIILSAIITLVALIAAVAHLLRPDLSIDGVTLGLLVLAILPWLAPFVKSLELPGGWKIEFQELKKATEEARSAAASAQRKAEFVEDLTLAGQASQSAPAPQPPRAPAAERAPTGDEAESHRRMRGAPEAEAPAPIDPALARLVERYNGIRQSQRPGPSRTSAMTAVVRDMIGLAARLDGFDASAALSAQDGGTRLAAYAFLYARPAMKHLEHLVDCVTDREDQNFGVYWGIQALGKNLKAEAGDALPHGVIRKLQQFLKTLPSGSDRHYELSRLLRELES
jgi:hypothetical protein